MTLHLHPELVPGCYRCDLSRHEAETIAAEQVKARGRHGSRVQRSAARRRDWRRMVAEYGSEVRR